jgi:hypothetical protein
MFMSRHQTTGQNHYNKEANKSFENVTIFRNHVNVSELQTKFGECLLPRSSEYFVFPEHHHPPRRENLKYHIRFYLTDQASHPYETTDKIILSIF